MIPWLYIVRNKQPQLYQGSKTSHSMGDWWNITGICWHNKAENIQKDHSNAKETETFWVHFPCHIFLRTTEGKTGGRGWLRWQKAAFLLDLQKSPRGTAWGQGSLLLPPMLLEVFHLSSMPGCWTLPHCQEKGMETDLAVELPYTTDSPAQIQWGHLPAEQENHHD